MKFRIKRKLGASLVSYGILTGLISLVSIGAVAQVGGIISEKMGRTQEVLASRSIEGCSAFSSASDSAGSQVEHACHFEPSGALKGGWTIVAAQYENDPIGDWERGTYPTSSSWSSSFAVSNDEMPIHSDVAFGRRLADGAIEILDAVQMVYTVGDIRRINGRSLVSLIDGVTQYSVSRDFYCSWSGHDPDDDQTCQGDDQWWNGTLSFDLHEDDPSVSSEYTWSFSPRLDEANKTRRGYAYNGARYLSSDDWAWLVLVR